MSKTEDKLIQPTEQGHYYYKNGTPCYTLPTKSKNAKNPTRPTTIRDCKILDLVPSVTVIINQLNKPALQKWKEQQILLAAATTPHKRSDMSADEWVKIVLEESRQQSEKAKEKGVIKHAQIEQYFKSQIVPDDATTTNQIKQINEILIKYKISGIDDIEPEKSFASPLGFGGKMDLPAIKQNFLGDIKTTEFTLVDGIPHKNGKKAKLDWPEHLLQLTGYKLGNYPANAVITCCNIYVSTIDDSVFSHQWSREEIEMAEEEFMLLLNLWWLRNIPESSMRGVRS